MFEGEGVKDLKCARQMKTTSHRIGLVLSHLPTGLVNLCVLYLFNFSSHGVCHIQHTRDGSSCPLLCESLIFLRVIYIADKFLFPRLLRFLFRGLAPYLYS